jgi:hypothetical protein
MARGFTSTLNTYLAGNSLIGCLLLDIETGSGTSRFTDNSFDIVFNSNTYQAQGDFLNISERDETAELQIHSVNISLSALKTSNITTYATSTQINKNVEIRRVFLNPSTNGLLGNGTTDTGYLLFKGKIAGYSVTNNQNFADIQLQVSSQFINFNRKNGRRTNQQNFQREHPNDHSMQYSHETLAEIKWGLK